MKLEGLNIQEGYIDMKSNSEAPVSKPPSKPSALEELIADLKL
jgi:hypothetical protein